MRAATSHAYALEKLGMTYPGGTVALRDVSLRIEKGEFVTVIGPSGAGKTTLLRCLNRLLEPTTGSLILSGEDLTHLHGRRLRSARGQIGMIFQQHNLVGRLSALINVAAGRLRFMGPSKPFHYAQSILRRLPRVHLEVAYDCMRQVGIESLAFRRADQLSGGQQQRVSIARALAQEPTVILADEPIASLDPRSAKIVMDTLQEINRRESIPIVANLHQVDIARTYGTRVLGLRDSKIAFDGPPESLDEDAANAIYDGVIGGKEESA
jgi:phosphonate transport system ATP-binding protein